MRHLSIIFLSLLTISTFAQSRYKVAGTVADTSGKRMVEFATIALHSAKDSGIVASAVTDLNGHFELKNVPQGRFFIKASHMSFDAGVKHILVRGESTSINAGVIKLTAKTVSLDEVVVQGKSTPVRIAKDTVEYNPSAYKPRDNEVVEDVLKKLPGVSVDKDGGVTVNGKSVSQIMVDGKRFFLNDPKLATQNLPADIVERIQIVDKKSDQAEFTKIDDGETEKIINLTLKKNKKKGYFGNVRAGYGTDDRYDFGLRAGGFQGSTQVFTMGGYNNINRGGRGGNPDFPNASRQGINNTGNAAVNVNVEPNSKLKVNGSYRFNYGNAIKETAVSRVNYDTLGTYNSDNSTSSDSYNRSHNLFSRVEYQFDSTTSMIVSPYLQYSNGDSYNDKVSHEYGFNNELVNSEKNRSTNDNSSTGYGFNLLFRKGLSKPRQTVSLNTNLGIKDNDGDGITMQENYYAKLDTTYYRNQNVLNSGMNRTFDTRLAYTHPLGKYFTGELNYKFEYNKSRSGNDAFDFNSLTNQYDIINTEYSRSNAVSKYNNATGAVLNFAKGKFTANMGANLNLTNMDYFNQRGVSKVDTSVKYNSISPFLNLSFTPSEGADIGFSYNGSTSQPTIDQIRPLPNPNTPNAIYIGNPNLEQENQHNFALNYSYFSKTSFLSFNNYTLYNYTQNAIQNKSYRDELGRNYYQAVNVDGFYNIGNYATVGKSILNNKLHLSNSLNLNYSHVPGFLNEVKYFTNQFQVGEMVKSYLTLTFLEVGADIAWDLNDVTYQGLDDAGAKAKKSTRYSTFTFNGTATVFFPAGFEVRSTYGLTQKYGDLAGDADKSMLWNASVTKKFLKDKSLSLTVMAFDILDQYKPFSRNVTSNYIEETVFNTISQTFMVTLSYNLNRFGGMKMSGYRGGKGRGGMPPGAPGARPIYHER